LTGMVGDNLIQLGPGRVSAAQLAFHVFLAHPLDDRLPADAPHIDVDESDITGGASSEGCILTALLATLVGDDPGDLLTTGVKDALYTLVDRGENHISREDEFVSLPERRSGRK